MRPGFPEIDRRVVSGVNPVVRLREFGDGFVAAHANASVELYGPNAWAWRPQAPDDRLRPYWRVRAMAELGHSLFLAVGDEVVELRDGVEVASRRRPPRLGFTIVVPTALTATPRGLFVAWSDGTVERPDGGDTDVDVAFLDSLGEDLVIAGSRALLIGGTVWRLADAPMAIATGADVVLVRTSDSLFVMGRDGGRAQRRAPIHPPTIAVLEDGRVAWADGAQVVVADGRLNELTRFEAPAFVTALAGYRDGLVAGTRDGSVTAWPESLTVTPFA